MKRVLAIVLVVGLAAVIAPRLAHADGSWLDAQPVAQWNTPGMAVPTAPAPEDSGDPLCDSVVRPPETPEDQTLIDAGWRLEGSYQAGWGVDIVLGQSGTDGMCRPLQYQVFVFVNGVFAGTLSPTTMDARTDGADYRTVLESADSISANFSRYADQDALCCPSRSSLVSYTINGIDTGAPVVTVTNVYTSRSQR